MNLCNPKPFDINKYNSHSSKIMNRSLCVPSAIQSYSLCIEYMKHWFLSKFSPDFFKSVYTEGKNIFDDFRSLSKIDLLKRQKPALTILPAINWDFDNDKIDHYAYGLSVYSPTGRFKDSFFKDSINDIYLGIGMEVLMMNFSFRMKFETRAQQMDAFKYIKLACRVGSTYGEDVDLDFHVPYDLILQIAHDAGFEICYEEGKQARIVNIKKFLAYLNGHSPLPFLYKHRTINGKHEFFIRMQNMYVHVRSTNIDADDGEREGQLMNNFNVDLTVEVRFPAPKFYAYYSDNSHELQTLYGAWYQPDGAVSSFYIFKGIDLPDVNKYGWIKYLHTTYEEDQELVGEPLTIDMSELFEGDLKEVIDYCISTLISPAIFIQIALVNGGKEFNVNMNWETMTLTTKEPITNAGSLIALYVNMDYMNNVLINLREMKKDRITTSDK